HVRSLDLAVAHDRALLSGSDRENGRVRRIDNGVEFLDPIHAEVRYRAGAALIFVRRQLASTRAGGKVLHLVGNDGERFLRGRATARRDPPARYRPGAADVGMLGAQQGAFGPRHVGVGTPPQRKRKRLDDEIVHRNLVRWLAVLVLWRGSVDLLTCS